MQFDSEQPKDRRTKSGVPGSGRTKSSGPQHAEQSSAAPPPKTPGSYQPGSTEDWSGKDPIDWFKRGLSAQSSGDYERALFCFDSALNLDNNFFEAWLGKGNVLFAKGNFADAVTTYNSAIQIRPDSSEAYDYLQAALGKLGKTDEAEKARQMAEQIKNQRISASSAQTVPGSTTRSPGPPGPAVKPHSPRPEADVTRTHTDNPIENADFDLLRSVDFAEYLALRIKENYYPDEISVTPQSENPSPGHPAAPHTPVQSGRFFMIHIYGPWGSGKTSLLNLLKNELEKMPDHAAMKNDKPGRKPDNDRPWRVVQFNAWREQHRNPPWLAIMDSIFLQCGDRMDFRDRWAEYWYRFRSEKITYLIASILTLLCLTFISYICFRYLIPEKGFLLDFATQVNAVSTILAVVTTVAGIVYFVVNTLMALSVTATMKQDEMTKTEREEIRQHIKNLVRKIKDPVALFIDDLDRCKAPYVVDLLEGIQTLFRDTPIVIVVAADRRWFYAAYNEIYRNFSNGVKEPGRPMEHLFIEKAFQLSVPMPELTHEIRNEYLKFLLETSPDMKKRAAAQKAARENADKKLETRNDESAIYEAIGLEDRNTSVMNRIVFRSAAALKLARINTLRTLEQDPRLLKFSPDLESNPRAMKRFVNAWDVNRHLNVMLMLDIDLDQLALWTILMMRWPELARYLHNHPETFRCIGKKIKKEGSIVDPGFHDLFRDENMIRVAKRIDSKVMEKCIGLCA